MLVEHSIKLFTSEKFAKPILRKSPDFCGGSKLIWGKFSPALLLPGARSIHKRASIIDISSYYFLSPVAVFIFSVTN